MNIYTSGGIPVTNGQPIFFTSNSSPTSFVESFPSSIVIPTPPTQLQFNKWPIQAQAASFYGNPRQANWLHQNTIDVTCPWELHMDSAKLHNILINKKCADSLTRVLNAVWEAVGKSQDAINKLRYDQYSGSYNFRPIRGSTNGFLSMHSYAAAIDWDSDENQQHSQHHLFTDQSLLIVKFKEEGWIWGGDWSPGSIDAMHVQAARIHN